MPALWIRPEKSGVIDVSMGVANFGSEEEGKSAERGRCKGVEGEGGIGVGCFTEGWHWGVFIRRGLRGGWRKGNRGNSVGLTRNDRWRSVQSKKSKIHQSALMRNAKKDTTK